MLAGPTQPLHDVDEVDVVVVGVGGAAAAGVGGAAAAGVGLVVPPPPPPEQAAVKMQLKAAISPNTSEGWNLRMTPPYEWSK